MFEERLPVVSEKILDSIALDERVVKSNKKVYYVYSAVDVERNELILMRIYTNRNYPVTRSFRGVLRVLLEQAKIRR
ncbi:hypothetical protein FHEFKHOI_01422 [Candidatus Methanoperedenaceae archaeon GB50]|nr:MAG: hypothetical protein KBONHNOK_00299 [Candidatus Methanoperedenaceae archaeon GB50]CAD7773581.1 hypothetical protein FHEFKHOI_01422 [Candidatus Methanoperedenaceae archaeon GB50]